MSTEAPNITAAAATSSRTGEAGSSVKNVTLRSSDGVEFVLTETEASQSEVIKNMIEGGCTIENGIPIAKVDAWILSKVCEYCKKHAAPSATTKELNKWDKKFLKVDQPILFELILAASYLDIKSLMDLTCQAAADLMNGKTAEEIRTTLNIKSDFTEEEQKEFDEEQEILALIKRL